MSEQDSGKMFAKVVLLFVSSLCGASSALLMLLEYNALSIGVLAIGIMATLKLIDTIGDEIDRELANAE